MQAREVMTPDPAFCTPDMSVQEAAQLMVRFHCGAIPVVDEARSRHLVGIVTDRDLACRAVAEGMSPGIMEVRDCMTVDPVSVLPETSLETCCRYMEAHQVRRLPVVDSHNRCLGIIAQADIAKRAPAPLTVEVIREVSAASVESHRSIVIAA